MIIYHNPRCRKSRETLQIIESAGISPTIIKYLDNPPTVQELERILKKLGKQPEEIIRKGEKIYKEQFKGEKLSQQEYLNAMVEHPKLIERPIVIEGDRAVIGRPPENVKELLSAGGDQV